MLIVMGITPQGTEVLYNFKAKTFRLQPAAGGEPVEHSDLECLLETCGFSVEAIEWNESVEPKPENEIMEEARLVYDKARETFRDEWAKAQRDADNPDIGPDVARSQFNNVLSEWEGYPDKAGGDNDRIRQRLHELLADGLA